MTHLLSDNPKPIQEGWRERFKKELVNGSMYVDKPYYFVEDFIEQVEKEAYDKIYKAIIAYIKDCRAKGYDDNTIVDSLDNPFILRDLIKDQ